MAEGSPKVKPQLPQEFSLQPSIYLHLSLGVAEALCLQTMSANRTEAKLMEATCMYDRQVARLATCGPLFLHLPLTHEAASLFK